MRSINLGRWSRRVERYFNIKGGGGLMDLDPSIRATLAIFSGQEDRFLEGWNRNGFSNVVSASAGNFSAQRIRNPAGSNVVVVVEKINCWGTVIDQPNLKRLTSAPDFTTFTPTVLDTRQLPQASVIVASAGNPAAQTGNSVGEVQVPANGASVDFILTVNCEYVIQPNDSLTLWTQAVNTALNCSFLWRERAMEVSELTG